MKYEAWRLFENENWLVKHKSLTFKLDMNKIVSF